jgi:murein DD-endopeptidase MepM/ murein hydrolase activator NlpD
MLRIGGEKFLGLLLLILPCIAGCGGGATRSGGDGGNQPTSAAPTISQQPQNVTVNAGQSASFTVSATGTPTPSYQWILNGSAITGATLATYTVPTVSLQQSGALYSIAVTNSVGRVTSSTVILTVNTSSSSQTITAISTTLTPAAPVVDLPNVANIDFTGQTALMGQTVSVAQIVDSELNALATDQQTDFDTDLSDQNTLQIAVPTAPISNLPVTVDASAAISQITNSSAATLYVYSSAANAGDGEDTFAALPATIDESASTIGVSLPASAFQPNSSGSYVADLKIGVASASTSATPGTNGISVLRPPVNSAITGQAASGAAQVPYLACPLGSLPCTERSRFNPDRYLSGTAQPHYGIDLVAAIGTSILVPAGGTPVHAFTQQQYATATSSLTCPSAKCSKVNKNAGISLTIGYASGFKVKIFHLSSIDHSLLNSDGTLNKSAVTTAGAPVAYSGNTGAAMLGGPHVHYEIVTNTEKVCIGSVASTSCKWVENRVDPFPYFANQLHFLEADNQMDLTDGAQYSFKLSAQDINGVTVTSSVGNPAENGGVPGPPAYDPTRKVCLASNQSNTLQFPTPDSQSTFGGEQFGGSSNPSYCAPWGSNIVVTGLASSPATVVTAKYSADATFSTDTDPLSTAFSTWNLGPVGIASLGHVGIPYSSQVTSDGKTLLVASFDSCTITPSCSPDSGDGGMYTFSLGTPTKPAAEGHTYQIYAPYTWAGYYQVAYSGTTNTAFIADSGTYLQAFNLANPAAPAFIGSASTSCQALSVVLSPDQTDAYVSDSCGRVTQFNVTTPSSITSVSQISLNGNQADYMAISPDGKQLMIFNQGTVGVVDLSSGSLGAVTIISQNAAVLSAPNGAKGFASGVYIGSRTALLIGPIGITIFDLTNVSTPVVVGALMFKNSPAIPAMLAYSATYSNKTGLAYVVASGTFYVINVDKPQTPIMGASAGLPATNYGQYAAGMWSSVSTTPDGTTAFATEGGQLTVLTLQ